VFDDRNRNEAARSKGLTGFGSHSGLAWVACQVENGQRVGSDFPAAGRLG